MYRTLPLHLSSDTLERVALLAESLGLRPGPGGSTASGRSVTDALIGPVIRDVFPRASLMVMALWPSSQLVAHRDPPIVGRRYHIPLRVNAGCWVFHDGVWDQLAVGHVYQMDPAETHGAVNWGDTLRLHLVIDQE